MKTVGEMQEGQWFTIGLGDRGWKVIHRSKTTDGRPIVQIRSNAGAVRTLTPDNVTFQKDAHPIRLPAASPRRGKSKMWK